MQQPVIAAVDPLRDDAAPAALGLMLARLTWAPLRALLLGGTTHALVRKAACPVFVVPPCSRTGHTHPARADEHAIAR